jgi:hypothetical protein
MYETTTEPLTLDIWRGLCPPGYGDATAWAVDFETGLEDARAVTSAGQTMTLLHARAKLEDVREIDLVSGWGNVEPDAVEIVEAIAFDDATAFRMLDQLEADTAELEELREEIERLREEIEERRELDDEGE